MSAQNTSADAFGFACGRDGASAMPPPDVEGFWRQWESSGAANGSASRKPVALLEPMSGFEAREIEWLWRGRVPMKMLTLFAGAPKSGKSLTTLHVAAAVSKGAALPFGDVPDGPASVVLLAAESSPEYEIAPRLLAAGADMTRIHTIRTVRQIDGRKALPNLAADMDSIEAAVESLGDCRLVVIDPITSYLSGTDDHRSVELRGVLTPLSDMADRLGIALVVVTHTNKSRAGSAQSRVLGSGAYTAVARANHLFTRDPEDKTRSLMLGIGSNHASASGALSYRIVSAPRGPVIEWGATPVDVNVDDVLRAEAAASDHRRGQRDASRDADAWLRSVLQNGSAPAKEILERATADGFTKGQAQAAKTRLKVKTRRVGFGKQGSWSWWLPGTPTPYGPPPQAEPPGAEAAEAEPPSS